MDDMLRIVKDAMSAHYKEMLPQGFGIYKIDEYSPEKYPAPGLLFDKRDNPAARYICILTSDTQSVPALGETVSDAINAAILKIEKRKKGQADA